MAQDVEQLVHQSEDQRFDSGPHVDVSLGEKLYSRLLPMAASSERECLVSPECTLRLQKPGRKWSELKQEVLLTTRGVSASLCSHLKTSADE